MRGAVPHFKRGPVHLAWLSSLLAPLSSSNQQMVDWSSVQKFKATLNSQVARLELELNTRFDPTGQIYIQDSTLNALPTFFYNEVEQRDARNYLYNVAEAQAKVFLYNTAEFQAQVHFIIMVPNSAASNVNDIATLVDSVKVAGKNYQIQLY